MKKFSSKSIYKRFLKDDPHGALRMPVYENNAFEAGSAEDLEAAFAGKRMAHVYSRISNPTVEYFEQQIKAFAGAEGVVAVSSGMAAIASLVLAIAKSGDNIITTKHVFGNTYSLFSRTLKPWGLETIYTDLTDLKGVSSLINKNTRAIYFEPITNPQLEIVDIKKLAKIACDNGIPLVADTATTPPYLLDAKEHGINVEVLSSTKYISGGATSVGGLIIDYATYDWGQNPLLAGDAKKFGPLALLKTLKTKICRDMGNILSPHNAYLQSLGLETLVIRAQLSCKNTMAIAGFLKNQPQVKEVNYPGLKSSDVYNLAKKQFPNGAGALLTFSLESKAQCFRFMNHLKIIRRATNFNDNKTLIIHPASTIFSEYTPELRSEMGVPETMMRLAVGIEDIEDLKEDILQALEAI